MSNELVKPSAPFRPGQKLSGLAARKAAQAVSEPVEKSPAELEHRIGIVFDDSGSMESHNKIQDAHAGVEEFLRSCGADNTAVAIYPMCSASKSLTSNLPALAIITKSIQATGGSTPLLETLRKMKAENNLTRMIVFSDGIPDSTVLGNINKDFGIVDTVLISSPSSYERSEAKDFMQSLATATSGIFLEFKAGSSNFKNSFKYLSPGLRYMLADKSFVDKIQK
jgi:hypothetical protein